MWRRFSCFMEGLLENKSAFHCAFVFPQIKVVKESNFFFFYFVIDLRTPTQNFFFSFRVKGHLLILGDLQAKS